MPVLSDVAVAGLGTEALADVDPLARCRPQPAAGRIEGWLPHAVIAAEDQRFAEHPGYELDTWLAVWKRNAATPHGLQGASTLTQQLAKILYTGDDRSATRKLREWLYAVEMERTLGKGRILQLYLAVVPWGDGVCGAEAAARHHLGKPAHQLRPREAAWLASLLVNPDQQLRRWAQDEAASRERAVWVLAGMKRLPATRRDSELDALATWRPPIGRSVVH
jgi:membrane peptidoglycan carboxypeptidase